MNETIAIISASLSVVLAGIMCFWTSKKIIVILFSFILLLPMLFNINKEPFLIFPLLIYAISCFYLALTYCRKNEIHGNPKIKELKEKKELTEKILKSEKAAFEKTAATEKNLSALYIITKILSETFDFSSSAPVLKEKASLYLEAKEISLFVVEDSLIQKIFGAEKTEDMLKKTNGFEKEDFIESHPFYYYAFRKNGAILFVFSVNLPHIEKNELLSRLNNLSYQIFPAIKRILLFKKIDNLSTTDGLTQVYRRGVFDERLKEEFSRAETFKTSLGMMIIDIDHFKKINDNYGHQAGDAVLKKLASILKENVYETDFVARYGGEEFAIIMPRAETEGAMRKAEHIRKLVETETFDIGLEKLKITISAGLANYPKDAKNEKELISKADSALYKSKETGRNKVSGY